VTLRIDGVLIVPMDGPPSSPLGEVRPGSIRIEGERIAAVGELPPSPGESRLDGSGLVALPGFVQGHVHLCQTLFRGLADDLPLLPWLRQRIWPLEAAHDEASLRASADLAFAELLRGGTTTVQAIETVHGTEQAFLAAQACGVTAVIGNCLMDLGESGAPACLVQGRQAALGECEALRRAFDRQGRLHYAVSPRFVLSVSEGLARDAADFAAEHGLRVHTHACEHPDEIATVRERLGRDYIEVLQLQRLLGPRTGLAHCVHTKPSERAILKATGCAVLHCPSANQKLGSGIAPVAEYVASGLRVALGADGAPCNNRLSLLTELRAAALQQAMIAGPGAWPAAQALHAATRGGALALGIDDAGCLVPGMRADLVLADLDRLGVGPGGPLASRIVYSADESCLRHVYAGGRHVVRDGVLQLDEAGIVAEAGRQLEALLTRAGLAA
jgi:5-methylthioadenosine/S-adenosylhomocysteine deaminase